VRGYASLMQPITRETVVDRRQPAIRWSAVLAGTAVAVGVWGVLQVLGIGAGLVALDPDDASSARGVAIGTGAWSVIAPLIAMFAGGFVAARLANTYDRRVAGTHALVMWGLTATTGLVFTLWMVAHAAFGVAKHGERGMGARHEMAHAGIVSDAHNDAREALVPINNRLRLQGKPQITAEQLVGATRMATDDGELDKDDLEKSLAEKTALTRDEAKLVVSELGSRAEGLATRADRATPEEHDAMKAAEAAGKGLLAMAIAILLGIGTAILGAIVALRTFGDRNRRDGEVYTTAPYPTQPPAPPVPPTTYPGV